MFRKILWNGLPCLPLGSAKNPQKSASPQHGVGRGRRGESWMPPELRKSIAIRAAAEWKP